MLKKTFRKLSPVVDKKLFAKDDADRKQKLETAHKNVQKLLDKQNKNFLKWLNDFAKISDAINVYALYGETLKQQGDATQWAQAILKIQQEMADTYGELFGPF